MKKELWVDMEAAKEEEWVWTVDWRERRRETERAWKEESVKGELGTGVRSMRARGMGLNCSE